MSKRNCQIHFHIGELESERLKKRVRKSGLTLSAYMRHLIAGRVPRDRPPPEYFEILKELRMIGRNINQIALAANITGLIDANKYDERYQELTSLILNLIDASEMPKEES